MVLYRDLGLQHQDSPKDSTPSSQLEKPTGIFFACACHRLEVDSWRQIRKWMSPKAKIINLRLKYHKNGCKNTRSLVFFFGGMRWTSNPPSPNLLEKLCFSRKPMETTPLGRFGCPWGPEFPGFFTTLRWVHPFALLFSRLASAQDQSFQKKKPSPSLTWSLFWLKNHVRKKKTYVFDTLYTFPSLLLKLNELSSKPVLKAWRLFQWLNVSRKSSPVVWVKFPKKPWEAGRTLPTFTT